MKAGFSESAPSLRRRPFAEMQMLPADPGHQLGGGEGLDHAVGGSGLESAGDGLLPAASPQRVAAYIDNRLEKGARPSALCETAAAIARNDKNAVLTCLSITALPNQCCMS